MNIEMGSLFFFLLFIEGVKYGISNRAEVCKRTFPTDTKSHRNDNIRTQSGLEKFTRRVE